MIVHQWQNLQVEPKDSQVMGPCAVCGERTHIVTGKTTWRGEVLANYEVSWTIDKIDQDVNFDLICTSLDEDGWTKLDRAVSLIYRTNIGSFMVIDSSDRLIAKKAHPGASLNRADIVNRPVSVEIFSIVDAIFMKDDRLREVCPFNDNV